MRAELKKAHESVVFVWGSDSGLKDGRVRIYTYEGRVQAGLETYSVGFARHYWKMLLTKGYRRQCSHMPCVPKSDYIPTHLLLNAFEDIR